jgi:hypothetical protein
MLGEVGARTEVVPPRTERRTPPRSPRGVCFSSRRSSRTARLRIVTCHANQQALLRCARRRQPSEVSRWPAINFDPAKCPLPHLNGMTCLRKTRFPIGSPGTVGWRLVLGDYLRPKNHRSRSRPHGGTSPRAGPGGCGVSCGPRTPGYRGTLKTTTPRSSTTEI